MNEYDLIKAVGDADPELVESAGRALPAFKRRRIAAAFAAAAAALALAFGIGLAVNKNIFTGGGKGSSADPKKEAGIMDSVKESERAGGEQTAIPPKENFEYVGFIKYNNTVYFYHGAYKDAPELAGEYLGRIGTTVLPGTPMEAWPDMSSYEKGDVYAVKGYDPEYMICRAEGGRISVFINRDASGVTYGRDVLETRFRVSEYFTSLIYEGTESLFNGYDEKFVLDAAYNGAVLDMLAVLDEGEWIGPVSPELDEEGYLRIHNSEQWRLTLSLGKLRIGITLFEGGYACVHQFPNTMLIRFDAEKIRPFWELLSEGKHGIPVESTDSIRALRPEQLYDEPNFGAYFPREIPEGYKLEDVFIRFPSDERTGEAITDAPDLLSAEYRGTDDLDKYFSIGVERIGSLEAYLADLEGIDPKYRCEAPLGELTAETVREEVTAGGDTFREVSAYDGNILITVRTFSLTREEMVELIRRCFGA